MKNKPFFMTMVSLLIIFISLIMIFPTYQVNAAKKKSKGYLLLIENSNGTWTHYTGATVIDKLDGVMCINAKKVSKYLGFEYEQISDKQFSISNGEQKSTYTVGTEKYVYSKWNKNIERTSLHKVSDKIHYGCLKSLVKSYKYVKAEDASVYRKYGYKGVLCISNYTEKQRTAPSAYRVVTTQGKRAFPNEPGIKGSITLDGVKIPTLDKFNKTDITGNGWSNKEISIAVSELGDVLGSKIAKATDNPVYPALIVDRPIVTFYIGSFDAPQLTMTKDEDNNAYKITFYASLKYSTKVNDKVETDAMRTALMAMCTMISSEGTKLHNAIFTDMTDTYVFTTDSWTILGDAKVKCVVDSENSSVSYLVKAK